ncbi:NAD(P)-dependent oxidoreductase [Xylanimonas protaetiae]|uniref:NAD-dependent epimerase/dehydratase family protein n=1 Tax=Xylanimonas protaetiae TaxID=2509457 RepID=A0A4P6F448_9MICO|nr:NAD(P)H-binding protein [Xylanimonas protaetiae]QAY69453.1 NAD-dependent epimerase/dehydratase family protein [Xylanimonas protaetiae]
MRITVVGGTGYAGAAIVAEAARRGHEVTALSRRTPGEPVAGVRYVQGDTLAGDAVAQAVDGADVVVGTLSPRGDLEGRLAEAYARVVERAQAAGARFVVVGGWSTLRLEEGGPRVVETGQVPAEFAAEVHEGAALLPWLQAGDAALDWLLVSPAAAFGAFNPGPARGRYRVGGEVALFDAEGRSELSAPDLALAIVDELERPAHHREQIGVAY